jgi:hypothetical protein
MSQVLSICKIYETFVSTGSVQQIMPNFTLQQQSRYLNGHTTIVTVFITLRQTQYKYEITIATFADDTAVLASDSDPTTASQKLQTHLLPIQHWLHQW